MVNAFANEPSVLLLESRTDTVHAPADEPAGISNIARADVVENAE